MLAFFLIVAGIIPLVYGTLTVLGFAKTDTGNASEMDRKLFSDYNRYFISRYWGGVQGIIAGIGAIVLGLILHFAK
jgi:hypothetical protein